MFSVRYRCLCEIIASGSTEDTLLPPGDRLSTSGELNEVVEEAPEEAIAAYVMLLGS